MSKKTVVLILILIIIIIMLFFTIKEANSKDRCNDYIPDVREASIKHLGLQYPYKYNLGCMSAESNCRPDVVSFDGGGGLYQFTPSTGVLVDIKKYGVIVNPFNTQSSINGQAFYISLIMNKKFKTEKTSVNKHPISPASYVRSCGSNLSDVYRFYNSGYWFFYESSRKPGIPYVCENREMFKYCVRGGTYTDKAKTKWLSFCEVSYSYPEKVDKLSKPYSTGLPDGIRFWYEKTPEPIKEIPIVVKEDKTKVYEGFNFWVFFLDIFKF